MTTEQNQPQASVPEGQPSQQAHAPSSQNGGQGRRRRRRRKGGKSGAQANAQGVQPGQQPVHQNNDHQGQKQKPAAQNRFYQKNGNGQNPGNGGGQRRKNKQRRQQVFVGPMDHSYRATNGNIADSPPSTIELRNGNAHGNGYGESLAMWEPPPAPIREDAPTHIYFFIEDLFFLAKIQETAKKLGIKVGFLKNEKDTVTKFVDAPEEERPSLIVFDLNNVNAKPLTLIPKLRSKLKKGTSIIGFLSHLQGDLKVKAVEAGCDMVMPRSAFSQNLPSLMRRHGLKDEDEEFEAAPAY